MRIAITGPVDTARLETRLGPLPKCYSFPLITDLALELVQRGHEVICVALSAEATAPQHYADGPLSLCVVPMRPRVRDRLRDLFRVERVALAQTLRDAVPDVVHAHWTYEFAAAAQQASVPVVVTAHDSPLDVLLVSRDALRVARLAVAARVLHRAPELTVVSPWVGERISRHFRFSGDLTIIGNPTASLPAAVGPPRRRTRFVSLANGFGRLKNIQTLLAAFAYVRSQIADSTLELVGTDMGPGESAETWAAARGLTSGVRFWGHRPHPFVQQLLGSRDVTYVHPSLQEACSMAILEALSAGAPVVGGIKSGGVSWQLADGAGLLVDVRRPISLAEGMMTMALPRGVAEECVAAGHRRIETTFNWPAVLKAYEAAYERALTRQGPR